MFFYGIKKEKKIEQPLSKISENNSHVEWWTQQDTKESNEMPTKGQDEVRN